MNQTTVHDIHSHLSRYLSNATTLGEFRNWFDDETWGLAAEPDSHARRIAGEIELRIAEFTGGLINEEELRKLLTPLVPDTVTGQIESMNFQIPVTEREPVLTTFS